MTDFDPWALSTGLSEVVSGEIADAYFSFDNSYDNGNTCVLKLVVADATLGEQTLLYPCKDFEPYDNGNKVRHSSGAPKNYNAQSGMGVLLKSAMDAGLRDTLGAKGDPFTASIWKGLNVTFRQKEFSFKNKKGEEQTYNRMLIDSADSDPAPTAAAAPAPNGMNELVASIDPALRGTLRAVALGSADANAFVEKVFTSTDFEIPADLEASIVDPAFFEAVKVS
jgi:hypothetical protein